MTKRESNPFLRFGLDPSASLAELTQRMRELAEDANDAERAELRAAWELLSRSPARRFELVMEAGPAPEPIAGSPVRSVPLAPTPEPTLRDVLAPGSLARMLPPETDDEIEMAAADVSFLVRPDEIEVTGPLGPRRAR